MSEDIFAASQDADHVRDVSNRNIMSILYRQKWVIALVMLTSVILGGLYYFYAMPRFESKAQILIISKKANVDGAEVNASMGYEDTLSTQMLLISSPEIVNRAFQLNKTEFEAYYDEDMYGAFRSSISKFKDRLKAWRNGSKDLSKITDSMQVYDPIVFDVIEDKLQVAAAGESPQNESNIVELSYIGYSPVESKRVLSEIIKSYQGFLGDTYRDFSEETVKLISQAKSDIYEELQNAEANYQEFRRQSPLMWSSSEQGHSPASIHDLRMTEIENVRSTILLETTQLKSRLSIIEKMIDKGNRAAVVAMFEDWNPTQYDRAELRNNLESRRVESITQLEELLILHGQDHPSVTIAKKQLEMIKKRLANELGSIDGESLINIDSRIEALRQEIIANENQLDEYNQMFDEERNLAKDVLDFQIKDEAHQKTIARLQVLFDNVLSKLKETDMLKDFSGISTQVIATPEIGEQIAPSAIIVGCISICLGLFLGIGIAFMIEFSDQRFRSPKDIVDTLQLPIIGHVPEFSCMDMTSSVDDTKETDRNIAPNIVTFHRPQDQVAESLRALRTLLLTKAGEEGKKVFEITSALQYDGKSTILANLAVSLSNSGKKTLILDANIRDPELHHYFSLSNDLGLTSVLSEKVRLDEAVQATPINNLYCLTSGPPVPNPTDLLNDIRFSEMIEEVSESYDFILIDTPPVLAVSDALAVAASVQDVILVLNLDKKARSSSLQAVNALESIGACILGIIVNRLGQKASKGYVVSHLPGINYGYGLYFTYDSTHYFEDKAHAIAPKPGLSRNDSSKDIISR